MRLWVALAGVCFSVQFCLTLAGLSGGFGDNGQSFITQTGQAGAITATREYEASFGLNWDSVRTFKLMQPLSAPLRVYIETNPKDPSLYKGHYAKYVVDSLEIWSKALDRRLSFTLVDNRRAADITVSWVPGFADRYIAGITTYRVGHADIEIKTVGVPDKDIKANILHEFGHALGIAGHSSDPGDIMVGSRRWQRDNNNYNPKLSRRDMQAIKRLYSLDWNRGEDLYSGVAQSKPATYTAVRVLPQTQSRQAAVTSRSPAPSIVLSVPVQQQNSGPAPSVRVWQAQPQLR